MLPVFIPSRSRAQRSLTIERLGPAVLAQHWVALVVPHEQRAEYKRMARGYRSIGKLTVMSEAGIKGIARTRALIGRMAHTMGFDRFMMFDDDLRFMHRAAPDDWHLHQNTTEHCVAMLSEIDCTLDDYAHATISARQSNNNMDTPGENCVRALRALAFRTHEFNLCAHGRVDVMEDFDVQLQLLAKGYPNRCLTMWTQDQYATQLPGGCSDYRSHAVHERSVRRMHALWGDGIVRLRTKQYKTGRNDFGKERLEATIYWKKALGLYERELI